ncbi:MAG TPA: ABC transporter ATP-binding protein [Longilinea sp.]|nr:ABC transporter ATP-binding protein [Longilinea sp.]
MIHTEDLTKHFDDFVAVDGVNLDVPDGRVLVLLGPNGAGKTTTVRMLTSVLVPTRGKAIVAGYDVVEQPDKVRASVGVLTEHHGLYNRMNAEEYLDFYAQLYNLKREARKQRIDQLLEEFGLFNDRKRRLGEYSKGMRQKLALVRALMHEPPILLFDEPTSAMDPESARMVRDGIRQLRSSDRTIILCTHNLTEAEELADQIAIIRHGRILMNDTAESLKLALLGPAEYEARLANSVNGWKAELPSGVLLTGQGDDWLRFRVDSPDVANPVLLQLLISSRLRVISFQPVQRSLEAAYLEAVGRAAAEEDHVRSN